MSTDKVIVPATHFNAIIDRLSRLYYSPRDPEQFMMEKLDLVRELRSLRG